MKKPSSNVAVLTANRLLDGAVVFLNFDGDWTEILTAGVVVARSPDEARGLEARGAHDAARNLVVDPYLVEMQEAAGGSLQPLTQRERRPSGSSICPDVPGYLAPGTAGGERRAPVAAAGRADGPNAEAA